MGIKLYPQEIIDYIKEIDTSQYDIDRGLVKIKFKRANYYKVIVSYEDYSEPVPTIELYHRKTDYWPEEPYRIVSGFKNKSNFFDFLENVLEDSTLNFENKKY